MISRLFATSFHLFTKRYAHLNELVMCRIVFCLVTDQTHTSLDQSNNVKPRRNHLKDYVKKCGFSLAEERTK